MENLPHFLGFVLSYPVISSSCSLHVAHEIKDPLFAKFDFNVSRATPAPSTFKRSLDDCTIS
jgi:hypothetical protein